jgi:hypothetical protein
MGASLAAEAAPEGFRGHTGHLTLNVLILVAIVAGIARGAWLWGVIS